MEKIFRIFSIAMIFVFTFNIMEIPTTAADYIDGNIVNGGWYRIQHVSSGKYLRIADGSKKNGAKLQICDLALDNSSVFQIYGCDDGTIKFISYNSGKVIEVNGSSKEDRAEVQQWTDKGYNNSLWYIERDENGFYSFRNRHSNKYLNVEGNCSENNTRLIQYRWDGTDAEKFKLVGLGIRDVSDATWITYADELVSNETYKPPVINETLVSFDRGIPQDGQRILYSVSYISHNKLIDIVCDNSKKDTITDILQNFSINEITDIVLEDALGEYAIFGRLLCALLGSEDNATWNHFIECARNALHNPNAPGLEIRTYITFKYENINGIWHCRGVYDYTSDHWYGGYDDSLSRFDSNGEWWLEFGYHSFNYSGT